MVSDKVMYQLGGDPDIVSRLKTWVIDAAFPLWATRGWDDKQGGFIERLDADGVPDMDAARRLRVQARQIYCFAKAARLGWYPEGREIALRGLDYMVSKARSPDGKPGYVGLLARDGSVLSSSRDTYDHAFVLLALATVFELDRDAQVRAEIESVLAFLDTDLKSPHGGYLEGVPGALPRRQNPHMHLFEAMIALFDATKDSVFQNRAGDFFQLLCSHFYDTRTKLLGEYFEDDWSRIPPVSVEPGHQAEWVWLLKVFERITGCPTGTHRAGLLGSAMRYRDPQTGCLIDEGREDGSIAKPSRRCWPQTECAKAWIAQVESGEAHADDEAIAALARLEEHYLRHPVRGGWYDQFDEKGRSMVQFIPASSFYHVLVAIAEADRVLG